MQIEWLYNFYSGASEMIFSVGRMSGINSQSGWFSGCMCVSGDGGWEVGYVCLCMCVKGGGQSSMGWQRWGKSCS